MNTLSRALGRWLFNPYRCSLCKQLMNVHDGLKVDPNDTTKVVHKVCKRVVINGI